MTNGSRWRSIATALVCALALSACRTEALDVGSRDRANQAPGAASARRHADPPVAPAIVLMADTMAGAVARPTNVPVRQGPGGVKLLDLQGGYQHVLVASKQPSGGVAIECVDSQPALETALAGRHASAVRE